MRTIQLSLVLLRALACLIILSAGNLLAQNEIGHGGQLQRLTEQLKLNEAQVEEVRLLLVEIDSLAPLDRESANRDWEAAREQMAKRGQLMEKKLADILTEEQLVQYKEMNRHPNRQEEDLVEVLTERLELTPKQAKKIQGIIDDYQPSLDMLRKEMRQGMDQEERMEIVERMRSLRSEIDRDIEKKLTDDQIDEYRDYKKERQSRQRGRRSRWGGRG